jgi:cell division protein FtsI (penicillin-binding protein 3)
MSIYLTQQKETKRIAIVFSLCALIFILFSIKIVFISIDDKNEKKTYYHPKNIYKGSILDRNGHILAGSLSTFSIYAHPEKIKNKKFVSEKLANILKNKSKEDIFKKISSDKAFVWIARHVAPEKKKMIDFLGIEGLSFQKSVKRIYPYKRLFSHIIGLTDIDQKGLCGLEKSLERKIENGQKDIFTSLDVRFQSIVYDELLKQMTFFNAPAANSILCHAKTGEILAMVSFPDFSPNDTRTHNAANFFNRNITGSYEFGSIMKVYNVALFLENKVGSLKSIFDATHPLSIGRFKVKDYYGKNRPLSVYEGFIHSSNIVNAKMAWMSGEEKQRLFFKKMGFFSSIETILSERARSFMVQKKWSTDRVMTAGYGYGFAVTPLHVMKSFISLVTGNDQPVDFLHVKNRTAPKKILSTKTVLDIRKLLKDAAEKGCARNAFTSLCCVGAKTGTANLRNGKNYVQGENLASCIAAFPIHDPEYVLLVSIEKPEKKKETLGRTTGGWIAAPVVKSIVEKMAPIIAAKSF